MRVLLDAHISGRHIGHPLRSRGHDVLALIEDDELSTLSDEDVMVLAAQEQRTVVTSNVRHFVPIARRWNEVGMNHAGVILVTHGHQSYGEILRGLDGLFRRRPEQAEWIDRVEFLSE
ncbi:MAG TPA: DUF5615 family PIN-like protein [Candidatus Limnocylindria bacterium]|nr:DUF5615 family PIN-like protein [Candidatus Limnocylindria bacterium]